jgi:hypothetical protein
LDIKVTDIVDARCKREESLGVLFFAAHCFLQNWIEGNIELACAVVLVV